MRGGLKLKGTGKHFIPVLEMIAKGNLTKLTTDSLKGFMFKLDVTEEDAQFLDLGFTRRFNVPVTSYVLKITVLANKNDTRLEPYQNHPKACESKESFFQEARLQQHIWTTNLRGGRSAICPSIANLALFENITAIRLLNYMMKKTKDIRNIYY